MSEVTVSSLGSELASACQEYLAELQQVGAETWERKPAAGEGEEAWSARQVAEHVQGACGFFGNAIGKAAGIDGPGRTYSELLTPAAAVEGLPPAIAALQAVIANLDEAKLAIAADAPWGKSTVGGIVRGAGSHFRDHANQIRTLRG